MLKEFLMKKMLQAKLKDMPHAEQEKMLAIMQKNPDFFVTVAREIQMKMKEGKSEMDAAVEVMANHQDELTNIMRP